MSSRSQKIIISSEARVLKALRHEHRLSMREAAKRAGVSDSWIAHIETGRMDVPNAENLEKLLAVYGGIKQKSFHERVRKFAPTVTARQEASELLIRMNDQQLKLALPILKGILGQ